MTVEAIKNIDPICECGSSSRVRDRRTADIICTNCGLVSIEKIPWTDQGYNIYSQEQLENRVHNGPPLSNKIPDFGLSTEIGKHNRDYNKHKLSPNGIRKSQKLRKTQNRETRRDSFSKNLGQAVTEFELVASQMDIPDKIIDEAIRIYRRLKKISVAKGYTIEPLVCACLYAASRIVKLPRTLDELAIQSSIPKKEIYRAFSKCLIKFVNVPLPTPRDFISRFCSELALSGKAYLRAIEITKLPNSKHLLNGKNYIGIAIATIYISSIISDEKVTQHRLSQIANISEVTIRNRYKELCSKLKINLDVWDILKYLVLFFDIGRKLNLALPSLL